MAIEREPSRCKRPSFHCAVVHAANEMPYAELIAVIDAVARSKRPYASGGKVSETNAFKSFASD